jgi:glycerol-3-phosphate acyltransferase PlsY
VIVALPWNIVIVVAASYLVGSIPASYIAGRWLRGIDLREHGSGNLGAANAFRVLGFGAAVPVLLFDIGKGFAAVFLMPEFFGGGTALALLAALAVVLGHNYSLFVRFSGGKGVGTTAGAFLALAPAATAMCFALWIATLLVTRIVSVASIAGAAFLPLSIVIADRAFGLRTHYAVTLLACAVALIVIVKHRSNISRLRAGTEKRLF